MSNLWFEKEVHNTVCEQFQAHQQLLNFTVYACVVFLSTNLVLSQ